MKYILILLILSACGQQEMNVEYYRQKKNLTHTDIDRIIDIQFRLATEGLSLASKRDTLSNFRSWQLQDSIQSWQTIIDTVELTSYPLHSVKSWKRKKEKILEFHELSNKRLEEILR